MKDSARPDPFMIADHGALDFLNSVSAPWGDEIEWLDGGHDLLDWMLGAGMITAETAAQIRREDHNGALDAIAARARDLREWFRAFVAQHAGRPLGPSALDDLEQLNRILATDRFHHKIAATPGQGGAALQWCRVSDQPGIDAILPTIAEAMGDLLCAADFTHVKNCEGPSCTMWFLDISKNHTRRWCSMAVCGNRAKAAAFRARKAKRP